MRKIVHIFLISIVFVSCSVGRRQKRTSGEVTIQSSQVSYEDIVNQNITSKSFFVERAEFRIKTEEGEKSGLGTIKFLTPDKFLISIKSNTGIEIARIYLTGDSLMINDRMDKKFFYGSTSFLKKKFGFTTSILPLIFGDYINDAGSGSGKIECADGTLNIVGSVKDVRIEYQIDCEHGKSILALPEVEGNVSGLSIKYGDFFNVNSINIPEKIEIAEGQRSTVIEIKIEKIIIPWDGKIEFIPGKQYEKIHLP